jgi:nucleoside-diphosphate-sugar epimerase
VRVLVLGADRFIGRHIAFALRDAGWDVTAQARRTGRLAAMGFAVLPADLTDPR